MKTILDNKEFRKAFKRRCKEQNIPLFYTTSVVANFFSFVKTPSVYLKGDLGDEVFDATYEALQDIGFIDGEIDLKVSPYNVLKMEPVNKKVKNPDGECVDEYVGMNVIFTRWCPNFGKDRSDMIVCSVCPEWCKQYVNCGKFYCKHNKTY